MPGSQFPEYSASQVFLVAINADGTFDILIIRSAVKFLGQALSDYYSPNSNSAYLATIYEPLSSYFQLWEVHDERPIGVTPNVIT